jgi:hypothetical protein
MYSKSVTAIFTIILAVVIGTLGVSASGKLPGTEIPTEPSGKQAGQTQPLTPVGSGFTYQGRLNISGSPANGQFDLTFNLWDAASGGTLVSGPLPKANQTVNNGLFTVSLNFGGVAFRGSELWLEIAVRPAGVGSYTTLSPRQALTPAPYAMSLIPGAVVTGTIGLGSAVFSGINKGSGIGVYGNSDGFVGVYGSTYSANSEDSAVYGLNGGEGPGVIGVGSSVGVWGKTITGVGVYASNSSSVSAAMFATNTAGIAIRGESAGANASAVYGLNNANGTGVTGISTGGVGVSGSSVGNVGVQANSTNSIGLNAFSQSYYGILAQSNGGTGILGTSFSATGIRGTTYGGTGTDAGVYGKSDAANSNGVIGEANNGTFAYGVWGKSTSGYAGYFTGNVHVTGTCCMSAEGSFQIDHPQDPGNKYLNMAAVASPEMKDVYDGIVVTGANGEALVTMPSYFEALNRDFRYQLTVVGQFAQAIVSSEIKDNRFTIKTDKPNVKVSWQVTGIRHDPYAEQHPITSEQAKPANERGFYLHPELYNQPDSKQIDNARPGMRSERPGGPADK